MASIAELLERINDKTSTSYCTTTSIPKIQRFFDVQL